MLDTLVIVLLIVFIAIVTFINRKEFQNIMASVEQIKAQVARLQTAISTEVEQATVEIGKLKAEIDRLRTELLGTANAAALQEIAEALEAQINRIGGIFPDPPVEPPVEPPVTPTEG